MKKVTKILIVIALLLLAFSLNAQQDCATICHNGTLVKAIGANAVSGHLDHHSEDILISIDCDYEIVGDECERLSLPKLRLNDIIPLNKRYALYTIHGQLLRLGVTDSNFKTTLPKWGVYMVKIEGYEAFKFVIE